MCVSLNSSRRHNRLNFSVCGLLLRFFRGLFSPTYKSRVMSQLTKISGKGQWLFFNSLIGRARYWSTLEVAQNDFG